MGELRRRLIHAAGSGIPGLYLAAREFGVAAVSWTFIQRLLVFGSAVVLALELFRLAGRVDWSIYDRLIREYERENLAGYALYVFGMTAVALAFPPRIALPGMLMLAVGDPISGLLSSGRLVKRGWVLAAMFGVCLFLAAWFVPPAVAVAGAFVAALADGVKPVVRTHVIDDNLTIPIGACAAMSLGYAVFPSL